ncbi:MAG: hypothetical protein FJ125_11950 [Deltaproteobacteria bacterium]|nr:hypothetical protein [Deltaproteobacteria bacterium]
MKSKQSKAIVPRRGVVAPRGTPQSAGTVIPVTSPAGRQGFVYQVNPGDLPTPTRQFYAHMAHAERKLCEIELAFGQLAPGSWAGQESYLTLFINLALDHLPALLDGARRLLEPLERHLETKQIQVVDTAPFPQDPAQAVYLRANLVGIAFWGLESVLDFHYLSPWEYQKLGQGKEPTVEQVVRVSLSTAVSAALLRRLFQFGEPGDKG